MGEFMKFLEFRLSAFFQITAFPEKSAGKRSCLKTDTASYRAINF